MRQKIYNSTTSTWEYVDSALPTEDGVVKSSTTAKLTTGPTAPASPSEGDVWVDTSSSVFPIGTEDIADGAVTSSKIDWSTVGMAGGIFAANATTITITGLGFKPKEVEFTFSPGAATTGIYFASGWSIDDGTPGGQHRSTAIYGGGSGSGVSWRRVSSAGHSVLLSNGSATFVRGKVTEWNDDGFVVTFNSTGGSSDTFYWKARQ